MFVPRRSVLTTPASRSTFRWWLTVGCVTPQQSVKSQAHTAPCGPLSSRTIESRTGSAIAWRSWMSESLSFTTNTISNVVNIDRNLNYAIWVSLIHARAACKVVSGAADLFRT